MKNSMFDQKLTGC